MEELDYQLSTGRILTRIATGDISDLGDTSTLADPSVVDGLVEERTETVVVAPS
jgi:hypothetical protein